MSSNNFYENLEDYGAAEDRLPKASDLKFDFSTLAGFQAALSEVKRLESRCNGFQKAEKAEFKALREKIFADFKAAWDKPEFAAERKVSEDAEASRFNSKSYLL